MAEPVAGLGEAELTDEEREDRDLLLGALDAESD